MSGNNQVPDVFLPPPSMNERPAVKKAQGQFLLISSLVLVVVVGLAVAILTLRSIESDRVTQDEKFAKALKEHQDRIDALSRYAGIEKRIAVLTELAPVPPPGTPESGTALPTPEDIAQYQRAMEARGNPSTWLSAKHEELRVYVRSIKPDPALMAQDVPEKTWKKDEAARLVRGTDEFLKRLETPRGPEARTEGKVK